MNLLLRCSKSNFVKTIFNLKYYYNVTTQHFKRRLKDGRRYSFKAITRIFHIYDITIYILEKYNLIPYIIDL